MKKGGLVEAKLHSLLTSPLKVHDQLYPRRQLYFRKFRPWTRTACSFRSAQAATLLEFMYHSRSVLSVGGSVWYMIRNLRYTVTIDSVLASSKTQNSFLFTVNAIFLHDYPLAVEYGNTPRPLVQTKLGEILYLLICSFLPCLSWLLRSQVRKSRRDL